MGKQCRPPQSGCGGLGPRVIWTELRAPHGTHTLTNGFWAKQFPRRAPPATPVCCLDYGLKAAELPSLPPPAGASLPLSSGRSGCCSDALTRQAGTTKYPTHDSACLVETAEHASAAHSLR